MVYKWCVNGWYTNESWYETDPSIYQYYLYIPTLSISMVNYQWSIHQVMVNGVNRCIYISIYIYILMHVCIYREISLGIDINGYEIEMMDPNNSDG